MFGDVRKIKQGATGNVTENGRRVVALLEILLIGQPEALFRVSMRYPTRPDGVEFLITPLLTEVKLWPDLTDTSGSYEDSCAALLERVTMVAVEKDQGTLAFQLAPEVLEKGLLSIGLVDPTSLPVRFVRAADHNSFLFTHVTKALLSHPTVRRGTERVGREFFLYRREVSELEGIAMNKAITAWRKCPGISGARR